MTVLWSAHIFVVALALLIYSCTTHLAGVRRTPSAAIAWVLGLVLLPYVVLPLYLFFGRRKTRRGPGVCLSRAARDMHWADALIRAFGLPGPTATWVRFHADGEQARTALWQIIDGAQESLEVCTFLIGEDEFGRELISRLARRAREGIRVRLLIDGAGLWLGRHPSCSTLRSAGGQVRIFHPLLSLRRFGSRNLRNHRKVVVADRKRLWSGGRNFAARYFGASRGSTGWLDLSFELEGPVVLPVANQFEHDWDPHSPKLEDRIPGAGMASGSPVQYVPSGPDQVEDTVESLLLAACVRARDCLLAVTPYFVPDDALLTALRLAILRGVKVTLVLPASSNHWLADLARRRALRILGGAGAEIRLASRMVHAKAFVVDDSIALSGTANLDARSLLINYESDFVFYGEEEIRWLKSWIENLAEQSRSYVPRPATLLQDLTEGLVLALAFQL